MTVCGATQGHLTLGCNAIEMYFHQTSCAEVKAELCLLILAEDSAFSVSIRSYFKSPAATVAELDQRCSGIMLYCYFVLGCTHLATAVSSKINPHDSLPRAGFLEARESQNRQNTLVEGRKDKYKGPNRLKHEHLSYFVLFSLREFSVTKEVYYNEKFSIVPACDLLCRSVLNISLNVARQWHLLQGRESLSLKKRSETDFGRASLSWKAKNNTEGGSVCMSSVQALSNTCDFAKKVNGRKPAEGRSSMGGVGRELARQQRCSLFQISGDLNKAFLLAES